MQTYLDVFSHLPTLLTPRLTLRPVRMSDFEEFDLILGMDDSNISRLHEVAPSLEAEAKIHRMTEYCSRIPADHVPDPYYGGAQGFENVIDILEDACEGLLLAVRG